VRRYINTYGENKRNSEDRKIGYKEAKKLNTNIQREALLSGANILIDELFEDLFSINNGETIDSSMVLNEYLPRQFKRHYNVLFVKKFIVCVIRLSESIKTWKGEEEIPASTAECIALRAIVKEAETWSEMKAEKDNKYSQMDFSEFEDIAFPDFDFELLFNLALDGIEDTSMAEKMGMVLKPSDWFKPIYASVHPYTYENAL